MTIMEFSEEDSMSLSSTTSFPDGLEENIRFSPDLQNHVRRTSSMSDMSRFYRYYSLLAGELPEITWSHYMKILLQDMDVKQKLSYDMVDSGSCDSIHSHYYMDESYEEDVLHSTAYERQSASLDRRFWMRGSLQSIYSSYSDDAECPLHSTPYYVPKTTVVSKRANQCGTTPVLRITSDNASRQGLHASPRSVRFDPSVPVKSVYYSALASPALSNKAPHSWLHSHFATKLTPDTTSRKVKNVETVSWNSAYTDLLSLSSVDEVDGERAYEICDVDSALQYCYDNDSAILSDDSSICISISMKAETSLIKKMYMDSKVLADDIYQAVKFLSKRSKKSAKQQFASNIAGEPLSPGDSVCGSSENSDSSKTDSLKKRSTKRISQFWSRLVRRSI